METVRPWYGQPSDRGRLKNRTVRPQKLYSVALAVPKIFRGGGIKFVTPTLTKVQMSSVVTFNRNGLGTAGGGRCPRMLDTKQWEVTHWSLSVQRGG